MDNCSKFHQNQMKKSFIDSPFFCSEFQSVSRIVKIVHSAYLLGSATRIVTGVFLVPLVGYTEKTPSEFSISSRTKSYSAFLEISPSETIIFKSGNGVSCPTSSGTTTVKFSLIKNRENNYTGGQKFLKSPGPKKLAKSNKSISRKTF